MSTRKSDHFNTSTIKQLAFNRPTLRFGIGKHMKDEPCFEYINNVDIMEPGKIYDYGSFQVSPVILYHDIFNIGWRIFKDGKKIFHATDTAHLQGISAKNYDLYMIEANYDEDSVFDIIREKQERGEYAHQIGAINSHLSFQQANDFFYKNKGEHSKLIRLHESKTSMI